MDVRIKGFICFNCNRQFFAARALVDHIKFSHPFLSKYECRQDDCNRSYKDLNGLRKHLATLHEEGQNILTQFSTSECSATKAEINSSLMPNTPCENNISSSSNFKVNAQHIDSTISEFITKLYENTSLNRGVVQQFVTYSHELVNTVFSYIRNKLENKPEVSNNLEIVFTEINNAFERFGTEYQRIKYLEQKKLFIRPDNFSVGTRDSLAQSSTPNFPEISIKMVKGQKISIKQTLEVFLQLPNVYNEMKAFIESEENVVPGVYSSVFQGNLWISIKTNFIEKTVFPIFIFIDDFETLNPLGSRAGNYKVGAVYMSLANVPPAYSSLLENIFLVQLFYSSDRHFYGNKIIFQNLIDELRYLETEGLSIDIDGHTERVYFVLFLILGDNLGLNSVLGFTESFNSEYFCRMCLTPKNITQTEIDDSNFVLRTTENYAQDSATLSHGVKESCIFHDLPNFHVTKNVSCDLMHDCFEGILRYDMAFIIDGLLNRNYFDLELLNNRIRYFKFSKADAGNAMPQIKPEHLKRKQLIMSASEMLALAVYFGLLVGDLVQETEPVWRFYLLILQIVDILLQRQFSDQLLDYLQILIREHLSMFRELFHENLKPKYHFLLHYPNVIKNIGPPRFYWCMRYEAFHRLLKCTANTSTCRRNLLVTLSLKQQLRLSSRVSGKRGFHTKIEFGPCSLIDETLKAKFGLPKNCVSVSWIGINNILYKKDFALQFSETEFVRIKNIITDETSVYFVLQSLPVVVFCEHVQAFEVVVHLGDSKNLFVKSFEDISYKQVYNIHFTGNGNSFISIVK